ncbi:THO complex subunit 5 homolog isoform X2 [Anthonomus grandis grandis]|uniref:THO complex subunit 5 homolog isoform X2 n=1 Tax=Anthonomus grandis grandis TaxID=2921223 RepID=UPI0021654B22|nr:THO complex subunit 5 homolog isoform X2 [Anthonomus grandis grandis]
MVKDSSGITTQVKKKRKPNAETELQTEIYQRVCEFEEKEAKNRDLLKDSEVFYKNIDDICDNLQQIRNLKLTQKEKTSEKSDKLSMNLTNIVLNVCVIKKLNRIDKLSLVSERESLNQEKQKCDSIKLTCQNLVYELHHLVSKTNKCLSFQSEDQNIELVSVEDFMKNAPEEVTNKFKDHDPNNAEQDHALRLARLEWELTQRKNLAEECKLLEEKKKKVVSEITERKEKLSDLLPLLNMVIKAAKPLQEHLGVSADHTRKEHDLAPLLADPIYILYANIVAYKNAFETTVNVTILGEKDEAVQFNEAQEVSSSSCLNEDDSESESDLPEVEEVVEPKKRRHRKSVQQVDPLEEKKKKILEMHPLRVELSLSVEDGPKLSVVFSYYTKLRLVTANSQVEVPIKITANTAREILSGHNILSELFEGDTGLESPNPSTGYLLRKMGITSFQTLVPDVGYAYRWAQSVCGINYVSVKKYCETLSQQSVEAVLKIMRKRLNNRTHLAKQMQQLEQNILPTIPESIDVPKNHISSVSKWSSTTYQKFCQTKFTQPIVDEEFLSPSDLYYLAHITRGEACLQTFVVIKNTYPTPPPIFVLNLHYKGEYGSNNCDEIRDLEAVLNTNWNYGIKSSSWLLSAQLSHLCSFLDVYLEILDPKTFTPNAKFIRPISGRNRRRPFKFRKIGTGVFTQY